MEKLTAKGISVSFDGNKIIEDISIELNRNEIVCLLGVSGAGKTTLFNVLSGLLYPDSGTVTLDDTDITGKAGKISYMLQKDLLLPFKTILCESISPHAFASSFLHRTHRIPITTTLAAKMAIRPFSGSSRPDVSAIAPTSTGAVIPPIL